MDLKDVTTEELESRVTDLTGRLQAAADELVPSLRKYGQLRLEAAEIVQELQRRGVLKEDVSTEENV